MDIAHKETDAILEKLEKRLSREYKQAEKEVQAKLDKYLERFKKKDAAMKAKVDAGSVSEKDYAKWRTSQIMVGVRWENMRDTLADDYHNTNMIAKSITREHMPEVYALNHNYGTYEIEKGTSLGTSYTLYDRNTVEHILRSNPDLLPEPGRATSARIAAGLDVRWNRQQIQSVMLQGILQGESIPKLSKRLAVTVGDKNKASAVRNARTMTTRAQNYGRLDSYKRATGLGIKMKKQWVATLDHRTRDSHVDVDGEIRNVDEVFSNGLDCPGGMGPPEEVYNCRCTMIAQLKGFENDITSPKVRRIDGLGGMSYSAWQKEHRNSFIAKELRKGGHASDRSIALITKKKADMNSVCSLATKTKKSIAKSYVDVIQSFAGNEYMSIRAYQQGSISDSDIKDYINPREKTLEMFISKSPKWKGGTTYRAIGLTDSELHEMIQGVKDRKPLSMLGTSSWSSKIDVAQNHIIHKPNRVVFECATQNMGTSINTYSQIPYEYEVLVSKAAQYKPISYRTKDGITYIKLREMA